SIQTTLKYFPKEKVRTKPGGNAGGVNPLAWGTYCPGYAKMAAKYSIVLQPADWRGACFGDKWVATAYHFYNVPLPTEPAAGADPIRNLDGVAWKPPGKIAYVAGAMMRRFKEFAAEQNLKGYDGVADGVWTARRASETILLNTTAKPVTAQGIEIPPRELRV